MWDVMWCGGMEWNGMRFPFNALFMYSLAPHFTVLQWTVGMNVFFCPYFMLRTPYSILHILITHVLQSTMNSPVNNRKRVVNITHTNTHGETEMKFPVVPKQAKAKQCRIMYNIQLYIVYLPFPAFAPVFFLFFVFVDYRWYHKEEEGRKSTSNQ